jgi:hypothetical protein
VHWTPRTWDHRGPRI